ncbi:MAG: N-acetyl-gamma-glutamyl-phosphate reductase [Spirochaetaceae bacterium]
MKAAVLGATGYGGMGVMRLLARHPSVETILPVSSSRTGEHLTAVYAGLAPALLEKTHDGVLIGVEAARAEKPDVVFAALPHLRSAEVCAPFFDSSVVIDLSADFRIPDAALFESAYGSRPPREDLLSHSAYGLTEWFRGEVRRADIIANPGCYPSAALLPLLPLLRDRLITGPISIMAMSGISGAGRKAAVNLLFTERSENVNAYAPGSTHRHWAEISYYARRYLASGTDAADAAADGAAANGAVGDGAVADQIIFTPHLVPMKRGIAVTTSCVLSGDTDAERIAESLERSYGSEPFVGFSSRSVPETRDVRGSNRCDIGFHVEGGMLLLFSVIDNLEKGAAGQAVQNMNVRFGLEETSGLELWGEF